MKIPSGSVPVLALSAVLAVLLVGVVALLGGRQASSVAVDDAVIERLREGGAVLLFRHALTDQSQADADPTARGSCEQQRNLSPEGVEQARHIGMRLRELDIPIDRVYTSPFCRTVETARAIAGSDGEVIETDALVSLTSALDNAAAEDITEQGGSLIAGELEGVGVAAMVTHTQNIEALVGETVEEGDAVVLVYVDGEATILDIVPAEDW